MEKMVDIAKFTKEIIDMIKKEEKEEPFRFDISPSICFEKQSADIFVHIYDKNFKREFTAEIPFWDLTYEIHIRIDSVEKGFVEVDSALRLEISCAFETNEPTFFENYLQYIYTPDKYSKEFYLNSYSKNPNYLKRRILYFFRKMLNYIKSFSDSPYAKKINGGYTDKFFACITNDIESNYYYRLTTQLLDNFKKSCSKEEKAVFLIIADNLNKLESEFLKEKTDRFKYYFVKYFVTSENFKKGLNLLGDSIRNVCVLFKI